ncbi:MAG: PKD domain-containing protein [Saprospiraceae bacterium]|nr:PKD domain-containing protein [Saprospiraceae bacterium]
MIITIGFSLNLEAQLTTTKNLDQMFYDYKVISIDSRAMYETSRNNHFFELDIPKKEAGEYWRVDLSNSDIIGDNYVSQYLENGEVKIGKRTTAIPTQGHIKGDLYTRVSLTFNDGFVYGFIKDKTGYNYIEPLEYFENTKGAKDLYVVYNEKDLKPSAPHKCGTHEMHDKRGSFPNPKSTEGDVRVDECYEVEVAIANDFAMFEEFGSQFAVEDHAIGVLNNVQTNYDDEFADELQFIIVTQFTVTTAGGDPWSSSADTDILLPSFRSWANGGGFGAVVYDVASLWTDKNIFNDDGSGVIGVAYVGVVCTSFRYNLLENFTTNAQTKRVMVAHELGHNFSSGHDNGGSPHIMAPFVQNTTTWSSNSISSINNHIATRTCLNECVGGGAPPEASFTFEVLEECTPGLVQFTNTSIGGGTLTYEWEFPGGNPIFSTDENPTVTYDVAGTYNVTLTTTNSVGSDVETQNGIIDIIASPEPNFSYAISGTEVSFFNFTQNATSYFWDFGDGSTSGNSDPVHDYLDDGTYIVQLTASSFCGDVTIEEIIVIANPPVSDFSADVQEGCAPLTVQYTSNASNNTDEWLWSFEGGTPAISSEENPTVTYEEAGEFDVTLTVINETGEDLLAFTDFINVKDVPLADFSYTINGAEVTFTNFSTGGETYMWDFGDGNTSTEENPVHTYADGDYTAELIVTNECGDNAANTSISISLLPVASFVTPDETIDCATFAVAFESTSTNNPDVFEWVFEGGTPATSDEANPSVTYSDPGVYDVTLTVTNANGTNSLTMPEYITVLDEPISGFSYSEDGLTVNFEDGSIDADEYVWDFGDGNSSTEMNPIHTYTSEGIYTIELTVTNQCGSNSSFQTINNYTAVAADFSSNTSEGCANLVIEFGDASSSNVTEWMWTFEGGIPATSTEQNPVVTYETAGQYDVTLTVSHPESSDTKTVVNFIAVTDEPITSFEYFDDIFNVDFTNTTVEGSSFVWDFGDGNTSTEENPSHTYEAEGTYEVLLSATNECGTTSSSTMVSINALPTAGLGAEVQSGCGPLTVEFTDESSSNVIAWAWTFEGGNPATSTEENPIVEYATPGTYQVQLEVISAAGTDLLVIDDYIEVFSTPTAEINYDLVGNEITATNGGTAANSVSWTIDGESFADDQLIYTFPENGTYIVELTAENQCGTDVANVEISIDVYPEAMLEEAQIITCVDSEVQIFDNSLNAETKMWTLFGANPDSSEEDSPIVTYEAEGTYTIMLTVSNQYGESTKNFIDVVTVIGLPSATFTGNQSDNVIDFSSDVNNVTSYAWDFGDGNTSTEENPSHTFLENGIYEVTLVVSNECGDFTVTETFSIISNSVTEAELQQVNIYPNPAQVQLNIELDNFESDKIQLQVLDIHGKLIATDSFNSSNYMIDVSNYVGGTYMIRLKSGDVSYYKKVVILR